jgi:hypothetical protein|tara:strand:- start:71 stop:271 length:201 start_codon:yes stop_codon:yes gene_type:complete
MEIDITVNYNIVEEDFAQLITDYPTGEYVAIGEEGKHKVFRLKIRSGSERSSEYSRPQINLVWFLA